MEHVRDQIEHREAQFRSEDGLELFEQSWFPESPRGVVALVHGYAEHSSRYEPVAVHLARSGYAAHTFDLRGHGRSEGKRCFVRAFDDHLNDLSILLERTRHRWPDAPAFLLGHSMGGLIAALFSFGRSSQLSGMILSAPSVMLGSDFSPLKIRTLSLLGRMLPRLPSARFPSGSISRDPEVVESYRTDALVFQGRVPARTASEIVRAIRRVQAGMERIDLPLLVMHGGGDLVADVEGSRQLHARARSQDKSFKIYDGFYHEIMNEPERERVLADITAWLDAHV